MKILNPRLAFFAHFSSKFTKEPELSPSGTTTQPLIFVTGGLRTPAHLYAALSAKHAHLLDLGQSSVLTLNLPRVLKDGIRRQKESKSEPWTSIIRMFWSISLLSAQNQISLYHIQKAGLGFGYGSM
ncbi:hypothetical protein GYMLUDRAFT_258855 [Collybiopsis luxurians FD-317 M1]|nr:hypothetical protein GYMLUDRAFT_258855 [Collybiopsis luxurians FD-317 M1]